MSASVPSFTHPLHLLLLGSAAASAAWTQDLRPLVVGLAAEGLWIVIRPLLIRSNRRARRMPVDGTEQSQLRALPDPLRRRFLQLDQLRTDIRRLAGANEALTMAGIDRELDQVDQLVSGWLRLAVMAARMRAISPELWRTDELEDEDEARARAAIENTEAELDAIEAALEGVKNRVVTASSPDGVSGQLDGLLAGVTAAERTVSALKAVESGGARTRPQPQSTSR